MTELYVSQLTQMIADSNGISVRMEAGVPMELHPDLIGIAKAHGVGLAGDVAPPPVDELTVEAVVAGIDQLLAANDPRAFGANGEPKLAALRAVAGKAVTDALRDAAWEIVKARPQE